MKEAGWVPRVSSWSCHISSMTKLPNTEFPVFERINFYAFKTLLLRSVTHFKPNPSLKIHCSYFI